MKFRGAVIVLGAGASKGARVAGTRTPPLDGDFLTSTLDYFRGKHALWKEQGQGYVSRSCHISVPTARSVKYKQIYGSHSSRSAHVPLLKLHGSINWEHNQRGGGLRLAGCLLPSAANPQFVYARVPAKPYLIPLIASKIEIKKPELRERWRSAIRQVHDAPAWILWGYSFPVTDTISQVLFRAALSRSRKKKPVLVINPDVSVVRR